MLLKLCLLDSRLLRCLDLQPLCNVVRIRSRVKLGCYRRASLLCDFDLLILSEIPRGHDILHQLFKDSFGYWVSRNFLAFILSWFKVDLALSALQSRLGVSDGSCRLNCL